MGCVQQFSFESSADQGAQLMLMHSLPQLYQVPMLRRMQIDPYVIDVLLPDLVGHDRMPSAFLTYLFLYRHCSDSPAELSLRQLAEGTGLSKRSVQSSLERLEARQLVEIRRAGLTSVGSYKVRQPWRLRSRPAS